MVIHHHVKFFSQVELSSVTFLLKFHSFYKKFIKQGILRNKACLTFKKTCL